MVDAIYTFGWNYKAWEIPFRRLKIDFLSPDMRILEIGASRYSILGLAFDGMVNEIIVGYYDEKEKVFLENYLAKVQRLYPLQSKYIVRKIDAFSLDGKYSLILMKSVLGGLMRTDTSDLEMVENFLNQLVNNNIKRNGAIVTLDNGKPFFQPLLKYFGARRNKWRYFESSDFRNFDEQHLFGTFSAFSLETRLGSIGSFIDNQILYPLDVCLEKMGSKRTIIATMYRKHNEKAKIAK